MSFGNLAESLAHGTLVGLVCTDYRWSIYISVKLSQTGRQVTQGVLHPQPRPMHVTSHLLPKMSTGRCRTMAVLTRSTSRGSTQNLVVLLQSAKPCY